MIPAKIWGYLAFLILNFFAFVWTNKKEYPRVFGAMFIIGTGSTLFLTNMMERYFFAGIVSGLLQFVS